MASLKYEDGRETQDLSEIQASLAPLNISLNKWAVPVDGQARDLLGKESLNDVEKNALLETMDHYFESLKESDGYQTRDLIVLHPEIPELENLLSKFSRCHTHDDDEVRYIVDGEGVFGFVLPDGKQVALKVEAEDYINVPKNTEHWFVLTESRRIKAIRYFTNTDGWTPVYTETEIRL